MTKEEYIEAGLHVEEDYEEPEHGRKGGMVGARALPSVAAKSPYDLETGRAAAAGILGAAAATLVLYYLPGLFGAPPLDLAAMLGGLMSPGRGPQAHWGGLVWAFVNGVVLAFVYAGVLLALHKQSTPARGAGMGIALWLLSLAVSFLAAGSQRLPGAADFPPGGLLALCSLAGCLAFGVLVGSVYQHAPRAALQTRPHGAARRSS